jgi:hypothetical protein
MSLRYFAAARGIPSTKVPLNRLATADEVIE